jgi:hypothetical protein
MNFNDYSSGIKFAAELGKKQSRRFERLLKPHTRPYRCMHITRPKWRLLKKWFNRYGKQSLIGQYAFVNGNGPYRQQCKIQDVRLRKAGGHTVKYDFTCLPFTQE